MHIDAALIGSEVPRVSSRPTAVHNQNVAVHVSVLGGGKE